MQEIATFVTADRPGAGFYEEAARLYEVIAADVEGPRVETAALEAFCEKVGASTGDSPRA
jgi:hypothetical protein